MSVTVDLKPELQRFAEECVESGRYADLTEVMNSGLSSLQERERCKAAFMAMLHEAQAEADRDGTHTLDEVLAEMDQIIEAAKRAR